MKKLIILILATLCSVGLADVNEPDPNNMIQEQISSIESRIDVLETDPNTVIEQKLKRVQDFLADDNLGDDMRKLLDAVEFVLVNSPGEWVDNHVGRLQERKAKLEEQL